MSDFEEALQERDNTIKKLKEDLRERQKESGREKKVYSIHEMDVIFTVFV